MEKGFPSADLLLSMNSSSLSAAVLSLSRSFSLRFFLLREVRAWILIGRWLSFPSSGGTELMSSSLSAPASQPKLSLDS